MAEYIERNAAIAALTEFRDDQMVSKYLSVDDCLVARGAIERATKVLESLPAADVEPVKQWVPVTERLPKYRDGKVNAFTQYGYTICQRTRNGRWKGQYSNWITHWAYLPPPPETEYGYLQNVMTNADHIRNMTDKELAEFFCPDTPRNSPWCHPIGKTNCGKAACRRCMSKWLQQPVKEEQ